MGALAQTPSPPHQGALQHLARLRWKRRPRMGVTVQDSHDTLTVANQLADTTGVERRLVALLAVDLSQELRQRAHALDIDRVRGAVVQEPVEVEPVEMPLGLLHELEEVDGVAGGHHLSASTDEPDVDAAHVAW